MQNNWWEDLAKITQQCADIGDYRRFYEALKTVYGPTHQIQSPLRSSDGQQLLTEKPDILTRWAEHFNTLFSTDRSVQDAALHRIPHLPLIEELDDPPTLEETITAIGQLKSHKAAGIDGIPPEIWKMGGIVLHGKLHELLVCCWEQGNLPQDLRDAVVITLYKNKGEKSDCSDYRGITLLSIAGKVLARILLNRIVSTIAEENLPESQCGFRSNRGTTDMVFVLRQLQEKCREQNKGLYITFVDLTKAFDTVIKLEKTPKKDKKIQREQEISKENTSQNCLSESSQLLGEMPPGVATDISNSHSSKLDPHMPNSKPSDCKVFGKFHSPSCSTGSGSKGGTKDLRAKKMISALSKSTGKKSNGFKDRHKNAFSSNNHIGLRESSSNYQAVLLSPKISKKKVDTVLSTMLKDVISNEPKRARSPIFAKHRPKVSGSSSKSNLRTAISIKKSFDPKKVCFSKRLSVKYTEAEDFFPCHTFNQYLKRPNTLSHSIQHDMSSWNDVRRKGWNENCTVLRNQRDQDRSIKQQDNNTNVNRNADVEEDSAGVIELEKEVDTDDIREDNSNFTENENEDSEGEDAPVGKGKNKGKASPKGAPQAKTSKLSAAPSSSGSAITSEATPRFDPDKLSRDSSEYQAAMMSLVRQFKGQFRSLTIPCYVASGKTKNPGELKYSIHNTLYLEVHCPAVRPPVVVISDNGRRFIDFGDVSIGQTCPRSVTIQNISEKDMELTATLTNPAGPFLMLNALRILPPGATHTLLLTFSPSRGQVVQNTSMLAIDYVIKQDSLSSLRHARAQGMPVFLKGGSCPPNLTNYVGTQNDCGKNVFDIVPTKGTIQAGETKEIMVTFAPDHESDMYSDGVRMELFDQEESHFFQLLGQAKPRVMFLDGADPLHPTIESLALQPPLLEEEDAG
ncbi:cilia- and flagella-associated protein 74-like [Elysia marginata]|uniref:Cilia- and flagella-associated protein 74-like n=1 Tax=Elysia marginata TaxID=1093978 RepID=A0AAV4EV42_9GAST|nr:cilia- and flagella-associated protein 74-like [Elysia marginata]